MRVVYSPTALRQIESQLDYLFAQGAAGAAKRARRRIVDHVRRFLAVYPKTGRFIEQHDVYEAWIPGTRYVIFYRVTEETLRVYALYHTNPHKD